MGQNITAELSEACLKSGKAGNYNDAINLQQGTCALRGLGESHVAFYVSNFACCYSESQAIKAARKGIGSDMAQMPTRPSSSQILSQKETLVEK